MTEEEIKLLNNRLDTIDRYDTQQRDAALQLERQIIIDKLMAQQADGALRQEKAKGLS